ncbi:virulence associated protein [Campylobacterota bacterium]|nr:virulence associated protein [Campylobacterota bacterium]
MAEYIELEHIGVVLADEFMKPYGLSQNALARAINVPPNRINDIVNGRRAITADTDLRLTRLFGLSEGYFLRFQEHIDTTLTKRAIEADLARIIPISLPSSAAETAA